MLYRYFVHGQFLIWKELLNARLAGQETPRVTGQIYTPTTRRSRRGMLNISRSTRLSTSRFTGTSWVPCQTFITTYRSSPSHCVCGFIRSFLCYSLINKCFFARQISRTIYFPTISKSSFYTCWAVCKIPFHYSPIGELQKRTLSSLSFLFQCFSRSLDLVECSMG